MAKMDYSRPRYRTEGHSSVYLPKSVTPKQRIYIQKLKTITGQTDLPIPANRAEASELISRLRVLAFN